MWITRRSRLRRAGTLPVQCEAAVRPAEPAARPDPRIQIERQPQTEQRPVGEAPAEVAADLAVVPALRALEGRHLAISADDVTPVEIEPHASAKPLRRPVHHDGLPAPGH